jgi:exodeoxyribonuclease V
VARVDKALTYGDLSDDQAYVYDAMRGWSITYGGRRSLGICELPSLLTIGGLAGTGKTTLLGVFAATTKLTVAYVTLTGRASSILRRKLIAAGAVVTDMLKPEKGKGIPEGGEGMFDPTLPRHGGPALCTTVHRLLYKPIINAQEELIGWRKREELDRDYDLIVIDEASMIGDEMLSDLQNHGVPIMAVGDHGQLPPVMDSGKLMKEPMLRLEKIHRQAEGNPIIALAHHLRHEGTFGVAGGSGGVSFAGKMHAETVLTEAFTDNTIDSPLDVGVLCWTNRNRVKLNATVRKALGREGAPCLGEPVICLKNKSPVFNGMRGMLMADVAPGRRPWLLNARIAFPEESLPEHTYELCGPQFCRETVYGSVDELQVRGINVAAVSEAGRLFDFGYAMTVHKSQGSGFKHAIVYVDRPVQPSNDDWRRWAYTAVTRASERLTIIL